MRPEPSWTGPQPEDITAWTIVQAGHAVGQRFWQMLNEVGLTPIQFGVLLNLDLHPDMANAELARSVLITPQSMSELMGSLEQLGLVERDPPPGRGRRVTARLTRAGRQRLTECLDVVEQVEQSLHLSPDRAAALRHDLHHILGSPDPA